MSTFVLFLWWFMRLLISSWLLGGNFREIMYLETIQLLVFSLHCIFLPLFFCSLLWRTFAWKQDFCFLRVRLLLLLIPHLAIILRLWHLNWWLCKWLWCQRQDYDFRWETNSGNWWTQEKYTSRFFSNHFYTKSTVQTMDYVRIYKITDV